MLQESLHFELIFLRSMLLSAKKDEKIESGVKEYEVRQTSDNRSHEQVQIFLKMKYVYAITFPFHSVGLAKT